VSHDARDCASAGAHNRTRTSTEGAAMTTAEAPRSAAPEWQKSKLFRHNSLEMFRW
jgi:hypothetical protein